MSLHKKSYNESNETNVDLEELLRDFVHKNYELTKEKQHLEDENYNLTNEIRLLREKNRSLISDNYSLMLQCKKYEVELNIPSNVKNEDRDSDSYRNRFQKIQAITSATNPEAIAHFPLTFSERLDKEEVLPPSHFDDYFYRNRNISTATKFGFTLNAEAMSTRPDVFLDNLEEEDQREILPSSHFDDEIN